MRRADWLSAQLPMSMIEDEFFVQFIGIFQSVADTVLDQIDELPATFDPAVAPLGLVREMGRWLGVDWLDSSDSDVQQRRTVIDYAQILPMRGTQKGLEGLLRVVSGDPNATVTDSGGVYTAPYEPPESRHVRLSVSSNRYASERNLIRIVEREIPVWTTFELWIDGRLAASTAPSAAPDPAGDAPGATAEEGAAR